jgi:hypothetical protein
MSIGGVSSSTYPYSTSTSNTQKPQNQNLMDLGKALQSGNLSDAQSAMTAFQQAIQGSSSNNPFSSNGTLSSDVQSIQSALQSGSVSGAQQAFSKLTTDMKSAHHAHGGGHKHGGGMPIQSSSTDPTDPTSSTDSSTSFTSTDPISSLMDMLSQTVGGTVNQQA